MLRGRFGVLLQKRHEAAAAGGHHPLLDPAALLAAATSAAFLGAEPGKASGGSNNSTSSSSPSATVLVQDFPCARLLTLNKPTSLNATDLGMQCLLRRYIMEERHAQDAGSPVWDRECSEKGKLLRSHADSPAVRTHEGEERKGCVYILQGAGTKSFCAGGDIVAMVQDKPVGTQFASSYLEYQLDYYFWSTTHKDDGTSRKAAHGERKGKNLFIALWNGYVMGGGVGLGLHGHYRVASSNTVFSMPECSIGFFPDVGASYFLPRLDVPSEYNSGSPISSAKNSQRGEGEREGTGGARTAAKWFPGLGLYLGLTAARLTGPDLIHCGLATHYLDDPAMFPKLAEALTGISAPAEAEAVLDAFCVLQSTILASRPGAYTTDSGNSSREKYAFSLAPEHLAVIAECFTLHPDAVAAHNAGRRESSPPSDGAMDGRSTLGGPIRAVESVEEVVGRLQAVHTRGGNKVAAAFSERLLHQLWPALTGEHYRAAQEKEDEEREADDAEVARAKATQQKGKQKRKRALPSVSPTSLKLTLDMQRRTIAEKDLAPALAREYAACLHACGDVPLTFPASGEDGDGDGKGKKAENAGVPGAGAGRGSREALAEATARRSDFIEGVDALLIRKETSKPPAWQPRTLPEVEEGDVEAFYLSHHRRRRGLRQPAWDPYTPFQALTFL